MSHPEHARQRELRMAREYKARNRAKVDAWNLAYFTRPDRLKRSRDYNLARRKKHPEIYSCYVKRQLADPIKRARHNMRVRLGAALRGYKSLTTTQLIGCDHATLMYWLKSQFVDGMTWDNYGKWHIDHKRPMASFDLTQLSEQRRCCHYTNLQPLWAIDNLMKSDTVTL